MYSPTSSQALVTEDDRLQMINDKYQNPGSWVKLSNSAGTRNRPDFRNYANANCNGPPSREEPGITVSI
jgi:hypothetical protein